MAIRPLTDVKLDFRDSKLETFVLGNITAARWRTGGGYWLTVALLDSEYWLPVGSQCELHSLAKSRSAGQQKHNSTIVLLLKLSLIRGFMQTNLSVSSTTTNKKPGLLILYVYTAASLTDFQLNG